MQNLIFIYRDCISGLRYHKPAAKTGWIAVIWLVVNLIIMSNRELSLIFQDLADMEEIEGKRWESLAYSKVAMSISTLIEDVAEMRKKGTLREIEGVGGAIEKKIIQYLDTGSIEKHKELKETYPIDFESLRHIQGLGPKRIALLYREIGVTDEQSLARALDSGEVSRVPGFGRKSEDSLKKSLEVHRRTGSSRLFLAKVYDQIMQLKERMMNSGNYRRIEVAGSTRRRKETIGDIDILVTSDNPGKAIEFFRSMEEVDDVVVSGETKVSVRLRMGINCDLRVIDDSSYGAALQYFTGSKEHNIRLRDAAISMGLKLNEYGVYRENDQVAGKDEEDVYGYLGMEWIPPELRENQGEIDAARNHALPELIEYRDIMGDLHSHTRESDGSATLEEMALAAENMGLNYIALTEHSVGLRVANGLDEERFRKRNAEIEKFNSTRDGIRILKGAELEIRKDGSLDLPVSILGEMDVVIVALHQRVGDSITENTERVIRAVESGMATALAHPTGRMIGSREPYRLDFERIFQACHDSGVALEIDGYPERSDLPFDMVYRARQYDVKFSLGSDAHMVDHLRFLRFATNIARRGWLEKKDVLNSRSYDKLCK